MKRSDLEKSVFQEKNLSKKIKKQNNYCSRLFKMKRRKYSKSLNPRRISDNKSVWKNIRPFFSEKRKISDKITLVDQRNLISFSKKATKDLQIHENLYIIDTDNNKINSVEKSINK